MIKCGGRAEEVRFVELAEYEVADITVGFYSSNHGDYKTFDWVLGSLAHSFTPESDSLRMDATERWTWGRRSYGWQWTYER